MISIVISAPGAWCSYYRPSARLGFRYLMYKEREMIMHVMVSLIIIVAETEIPVNLLNSF